METIESGNGVKVANVVKEVINIINNPDLKRAEKLETLSFIDFTGRPGRKKAEEIYNAYCCKFTQFTNGKSTGKRPRGLKIKTKKDWVNSFNSYLYQISPDCIVNLFSYCEKYDVKNRMDLKKYANNIRQDVIEKQNIAAIEKAKKTYFVKLSGLPSHFFGNEKRILEVQENKASNSYKGKTIYCIVNGHYITVSQEESEDWNAYSKGWHNTHGPKRTIENRRVNFFKGGKFLFSKNVNSFAGNYLVDAIVSGLNIPVQKIKGLAKVQLNKYFSVSLVRKVFNVEIFERKLADAHIDFCAFYNNETFHASTVPGTIAGLQRKLKANVYFDREKINKNIGYKLGFCETGMKSFCEDNNINFEGEYSRKDLRNITITNRNLNCEKYSSELRKIGIIINCK